MTDNGPIAKLSNLVQRNRGWLLDYRFQSLWIIAIPVASLLVPALYGDRKLQYGAAYFGLMGAVTFGVILHNAFRRLRQLRQNLHEATTFEAPYVLFLRSFDQTAGYLTEAHYTGSDGITTITEESIVGELDRSIRTAGMALVAVGGELVLPTKQRVFWLQCPDTEWQENIKTLALNARAILLVPETTAGLVAELKLLRRLSLLGRTVAFMSPLPKAKLLTSYPQGEERETGWQKARSVLTSQGIQLPDYDACGAIFGLSSDGTVRNYQSITGEGGILETFEPAVTNEKQTQALSDALSVIFDQGDERGLALSKVWKNLKSDPVLEEPLPLLLLPGMGSFPMAIWAMTVLWSIPVNLLVFVLSR